MTLDWCSVPARTRSTCSIRAPVFKTGILKLKALGPWDVVLGNHPFLAPKDIEIVETELKSRGSGPHPAVLGAKRIDQFFDDILKVVDEKLIAEPPAGPPTG